VEELDKVWDEMIQSKMKPDNKAKEAFLKRKEELSH
jgi:hypothetical protein